MKALVVLGHPRSDSFNHALAARVAQTWRACGAEVMLRDLTAEGFDPRLSAEEARGLPSADPLVQAHMADLTRANLLCVVHPNMWGGPPAVMKGWVDRVFALHAAYTFPEGADEGQSAIGLLRVREALVLNTSNTPPAREAVQFGDPLDRMWRDCILAYCGVQSVQRRMFAPLAGSTAALRSAWLDEAASLAQAMVPLDG